MVYARVAEARSDWQTSQSRWQTVKDMWPDPRSLGYQMGTLNVAMNQRRLGQLDEAEAGFLSLRTVAPLNPLPAAGYAGIAEDRGDLNEAARRWKQVTSRFPSFGDGYRGLIAVLRRLGQDAEIEAALAKAVHYCVEEPHWFAGYAASAEQRGDFATAASRWKDMRTRFPQQEQAYIRGAAALAALGESAALAELRAEHVRQFTK
jgi:predicted Zn-dependent protease